MEPPAACLFDLDGLLLDTEPLHGRAWREAAAHWGLELSPAQLLAMRGRRRSDNIALVRGWLAEAGLAVASAQELMAVQQPIVRRLLPAARPIDGAPELVDRCLALGVPMALVTSSSAASLALKLAPHSWLAPIRQRVVGDDPELAAGKPAPDPFLLAARRLQVAPQVCWAFEDSPAGAHAAHAAGCRVHVLRVEGIDPAVFPAGVVPLDSLHQVRWGQ